VRETTRTQLFSVRVVSPRLAEFQGLYERRGSLVLSHLLNRRKKCLINGNADLSDMDVAASVGISLLESLIKHFFVY
jgi:hypothetical protein